MSLNNIRSEMKKGRNTFIVWSLCYLWFISLYSVVWSMFLFLTIRETLWITGTDLINLCVLLSGLFMFPANVQMLNTIANGKDIENKVICCPLWLYLLFVIAIDIAGAMLCVRKIKRCRWFLHEMLTKGMRMYRTVPTYKNFMDNLQWTLKCCGIESYQDWFSLDWFDQARDYDWDLKKLRDKKDDEPIHDSVPLSCCKSGACYPHYLTELGTKSINKGGCVETVYRVLIVILTVHLVVFCSIIIIEAALIYLSYKGYPADKTKKTMQFLSVNDRFRDTSNSRSRLPTDGTTTEPTDYSDASETDLSVLENSISAINRSIECVNKIYSKGNSSSTECGTNQTESGKTKSNQYQCESDDQFILPPRSPCCTGGNRKALSSPDSKTLSRAYSRASQAGCPQSRNQRGSQYENPLVRTRTHSKLAPSKPGSPTPRVSSQCDVYEHASPYSNFQDNFDDGTYSQSSCRKCDPRTQPISQSPFRSPCWSIDSLQQPRRATRSSAALRPSILSSKFETVPKKSTQ